MRVAAFQLDLRRGDVAGNLAQVERGLSQARERGIELVVLPEMWPTSFVAVGEEEAWLASSEAAVERVRTLSRGLELTVAGSAFARGEPQERPRNRLTVFERGEPVLLYDKLHLFTPTAEHEGFSPGRVLPPTVATRLGLLSGVVCYDLRFAPCLRAPFVDGAECLVVPAQWPTARAAQWRALVVGRAVEHQALVVAANRCGVDVFGRRGLELAFPGNSLVVAPDGTVLAEGRGEPGLVAADFELSELRALRRAVPVRRDQRPEVYGT
jgi:predicted amidohydrolase